ncbi:MAG: ParB/RepB/Spo0J family partition protein [Nitrospinaceae bacterium]|nr:ParB/RepB/Spo0J family partition protein [Nitrospinaceae bacterium]
MLSISVESLRPGIHQPRSEFDDEELGELADSVRRHGVLQPILVNSSGGGFEIVAGERRWRAAQLAGLSEVPAIVVDAAEEASLEIAVIENIQRSDLNPMEEAAAYESMMTRLALTQEEVATRVGKERSTVANYVRLLKLPNKVQESVASGTLSMGHARAILALRGQGEMVKFARIAEKSRLSVRQLEGRIRKALAGSTRKGGRYDVSSKEEEPSGPQALFLREMAERMRAALGTKVSIQGDEKKGQVVIEYYSVEILEGILDRLSGRE